MSLTFEYDPVSVKVNHRAKCLGQRSFSSKLSPGHTHEWPVAVPGSLNCSVKVWAQHCMAVVQWRLRHTFGSLRLLHVSEMPNTCLTKWTEFQGTLVFRTKNCFREFPRLLTITGTFFKFMIFQVFWDFQISGSNWSQYQATEISRHCIKTIATKEPCHTNVVGYISLAINEYPRIYNYKSIITTKFSMSMLLEAVTKRSKSTTAYRNTELII